MDAVINNPACPKCQHTVVTLLDISKDAWVSYFSCDGCSHSWNVPKTPSERGVLPAGTTKRIGRVTYEGRFVIIEVPAEWRATDPMPEPSAQDVWFDKLSDFQAALDAPWDHKPINRQPLGQQAPERPALKVTRRGPV